MSNFFIADTYFGDHRTINIQRRSFASKAEMDATIIANWNAVATARRGVAPRRCGAAVERRPRPARGAQRPQACAARQQRSDATVAATGWASVGDYAELELDGHKLILCHYPFRSWNGQHRGAVNLYGHSHGRLKPVPNQYDVGVDPNGFAPLLLARLLID